MSEEREIHRYAAYFKGWCQAFGEHEAEFIEDESIGWLYAENKIGLILPQELTKQLYRNVLGKTRTIPVITLGRDGIGAGDFHHTFSESSDLAGLVKLIEMLVNYKELHLYLTYHLIYPKGTRIITFSTEQPLTLIYKEIEPIQIHLI
jgi:hypothetical protein